MTVCLLCVATLTGCTSWALLRSTTEQGASSMDLRYRQVIENLAMVYAHQEYVPAYSTIYSGTADVNDNVKLTSQTSWTRTAAKPSGYMTAFATQSIDVLGSRAIKNTWSLDPTIVPEKLRALRAACCWVTHGEAEVGPDHSLLESYQPPDYEKGVLGSPAGYYFGVADKLSELPSDWLHFANCWSAVPRRACYWAGCDGKYVWVGPEGMEGLSQFTLIIQAIARIDFSTLFYPMAQTRTIIRHIPIDSQRRTVASFDPFAGTRSATSNPPQLSVTVYVDQDGLLTPGANLPAIPPKVRYDNVGQYSQLTSVINASSKSP